MKHWAREFVCRHASHDWWALAYPPARRWECHRCGSIVEEAAQSDAGQAEPVRRAERETTRARGPRPAR